MIRQMQENKGGLGQWTLRPEMPEESQELERIFPKGGLPPGAKQSYRWVDGDKGTLPALVVTTELDPGYQAPKLAPVTPTHDPRNDPPPSVQQLADWSIENLVTKAAELSVTVKPGKESKAAMAGKVAAAWQKRYEEQQKARPPEKPAAGDEDTQT